MIGNATKDDFIRALELYGADLEQWPPGEVEAALGLLAADAGCRDLLAEAQDFDDLLRRPLPLADAERQARVTASMIMEAVPKVSTPLPRGGLGSVWSDWRAEAQVAAVTLVAASLVLHLLPSPDEPLSALDQVMVALLGRL